MTDNTEALTQKALLAVVDATRDYLPPDGISKDECINRILQATDNREMARVIDKIENPPDRPTPSESLIEQAREIVAQEINAEAIGQFRSGNHMLGNAVAAGADDARAGYLDNRRDVRVALAALQQTAPADDGLRDITQRLIEARDSYHKNGPDASSAEGDWISASWLEAIAEEAEAALSASPASPDLMGEVGSVYVASRASILARSGMWRRIRAAGYNITSTWIDEAGPGETADFSELWQRIYSEIARSEFLWLYAEQSDFPLKGALIECGIAMGLGKRVIVSLPGVQLDGRTHRPIGSWIEHPLVTRIDDEKEVLAKIPEPQEKG